MKILFLLFILFSLGSSHLNASEEVSKFMENFLIWDAQHNMDMRFFKPKVLELEFVEIEIGKMYAIQNHDEWMFGEEGAKGPHGLITDMASYLPEDIKGYFLSSQNNKTYVKFYFHPYDQSQKHEVLSYLVNNDIPFTHHQSGQLQAFSTASKSLIAFDKETGRSFSLKTSTMGTVQGVTEYERRPYPTRWSYLVRRISDLYYQRKITLRYIDIGWEPLALGIPFIDQSNSVRLMEDVSAGTRQQFSGFVFNDRMEARKIAKNAGMDFIPFWTKAFKIKGRAMAEMSLKLGFLMTSNHAQNFRWELDANNQLTGKIVLIDLSDVSPLLKVQQALGNDDFLDKWKKYVSDTNPIIDDGYLHFSNFFRGDHNSSIEPEWHQAMKEGLIEGIAEILQVDPREFADSIEMRVSNKNLVESWAIDIRRLHGNKVIAKAYQKYLEKLKNKEKNNCILFLKRMFLPLNSR